MKKNNVKNLIRFAVVGAGNGGQAMAAHLAMKGYSVNLYNRSMENIKEIKEIGGITLEGKIEGFGSLSLVTDNIKEAIKGVDVIMITVPASGHSDIANLCMPYLENDQIIVLNPGRTGGVLEFLNILKNEGCNKNVILAEAQTFIYACRIIEPGKVRVFSIKNVVSIAALPSAMTPKVVKILSHAYPQFIPANNVLETSLNNIGAVFHPAPTLLNCGRIESTGGDFEYYIHGITPTVAKIIECIDNERVKIAKTFGVEAITALEWLKASYGSTGDTLYEAIQNTSGYVGIKAPASVNNRYIFEDIPGSLVPISALGSMVGVKTPAIDSIIQLACIAHNTNYYALGRNVRRLGIEGLTISQIMELVTYGDVEKPEGVVA